MKQSFDIACVSVLVMLAGCGAEPGETASPVNADVVTSENAADYDWEVEAIAEEQAAAESDRQVTEPDAIAEEVTSLSDADVPPASGPLESRLPNDAATMPVDVDADELERMRLSYAYLAEGTDRCVLGTWSVTKNVLLFGLKCSMTFDLPAEPDVTTHWRVREAWEEPKVALTISSRNLVGDAIEQTLAEVMGKRSDDDEPWDYHGSEREFEHQGLQFRVYSSVSQDPATNFVRVFFRGEP